MHRYSRDLDDSSVDYGLALEVLGFEQLLGGWFALVMKNVDIANL